MRKHRSRGTYGLGLTIAFGSGIIFGALMMAAVQQVRSGSVLDARTATPTTPEPVAELAPTTEDTEAAPLADRYLIVPVEGVARRDLVPSFDDVRDGEHKHEAIDIPAPRRTPVLAVEDGTIARLFFSQAGGLTVYQFDPTSMFAYYYAHLDEYGTGLKEGDAVRRGQVLGYVGTSGNAPPETPHLHFAIFRLTDAKQWWKGTAIDPYPLLRGRE